MKKYQDAIIRAKLTPPRPRRYLLSRPKLAARLLEARHYRLSVVHASAGYGKSTALVSTLREAPLDLFWFSITETDRDPLLFLLHLIYAFRLQAPQVGASALALLEEPFEVPADFDVHAHLAAEFQDQPQIQVRMRFIPEAAHIALFHRSYWEQIEEQADGSVIVSLLTVDLNWTASNALAYGPIVEVLEPAELRRMVSIWAQEIQKMYTNDSTP